MIGHHVRRVSEHDYRRCLRCSERQGHPPAGLCRRCDKEERQTIDDIERIDRQRSKFSESMMASALHANGTRRIVVAEHQEFEVVWDGAMDGAAARGILRADERPAPPPGPSKWKKEQAARRQRALNQAEETTDGDQ